MINSNNKPMIPIRAASRVISATEEDNEEATEKENIDKGARRKFRLPW